MNLFEIGYFIFVISSFQYSDNLTVFFYLNLKSILCGFERLILKFVGGENDLHHEYEVVGCNKLNL